MEEQSLQKPCPEFIESFFQVEARASVVVPQICVELVEHRGILGVERPPGGHERLL